MFIKSILFSRVRSKLIFLETINFSMNFIIPQHFLRGTLRSANCWIINYFQSYSRSPVYFPHSTKGNVEPLHGRLTLIQKVYAALTPGGQIFIRDQILDDNRAGPYDFAKDINTSLMSAVK